MINRLVLRTLQFLVRLCHRNDSPRRIALGVAVGMFIAWTPSLGLQTVLVILVGFLVPINRVAGVVVLYVSNPFTVVPMYLLAYRVGGLFTTSPGLEVRLRVIWSGGGLGWWERLSQFWQLAWEFAGPLWIGGLTVGLLCGALTYLPALGLINWTRRRYEQRQPTKVISQAA